MINLQRMVNPLGVSKKVVKNLQRNLNKVHQYVPPLERLILKIAQANKVSKEKIMITDGAEGALTLIAQSIFKNKKVVIPQPCFHRYKDYPSYLDIEFSLVEPFDSIFIDEKAVLKSKGNILLFGSPNNPTGFMISDKFLERTLQKYETVILDETLLLSLDGKQSFIENYPNLIIVRSFSKLFGLAGLRIGYVIATPENIEKIRSVSTLFKVNYLAQIAALAVLADKKYIEKTKCFILSQRKLLFQRLLEDNIKNSQSLSYCLFLTSQQQNKLKQKKIIVQKDMGFGYGKNKNSFFRITIGNEEENKAMIEALNGDSNA